MYSKVRLDPFMFFFFFLFHYLFTFVLFRLNSEQIEFVKLREKLQKIQKSNEMKNLEIQQLFEKNRHCMDKTAKRNRLRRLITEQEELINTAISINSVGKNYQKMNYDNFMKERMFINVIVIFYRDERKRSFR